MSLHIRLNGINSENDFVVSYKSGNTLNNEITGFTTYDFYEAGTTGVTISGVTLSYDTSYWVKIHDNVTNRYIIENIHTHEDCYFGCYDTTPTPTPAITPTPTPTLSVNSAIICIGDGTLDACLCNRTATVYFVGTLKEGVTLYTTNTLTTKYFDGIFPDINYQNKLYSYPLGGGPLIANGICITPTPTPTLTGTPTPTPTPPTPTPTATPTPTPKICNNVISVFVNSGIGENETGYVFADVTLQNNVSGDTTVNVDVSTNFGIVGVSVVILANNNYGYEYNYIAAQSKPIISNYCISGVIGDGNILCQGFACEEFSCPCNIPTPTPTPTFELTPTPTPTPTGYCVQLTNLDSFSPIDVTYINTANIETCVLIPVSTMITVCIKNGQTSNVKAYANGNGTCSGYNDDMLVGITQLTTGCLRNGDCNP